MEEIHFLFKTDIFVFVVVYLPNSFTEIKIIIFPIELIRWSSIFEIPNFFVLSMIQKIFWFTFCGRYFKFLAIIPTYSKLRRHIITKAVLPFFWFSINQSWLRLVYLSLRTITVNRGCQVKFPFFCTQIFPTLRTIEKCGSRRIVTSLKFYERIFFQRFVCNLKQKAKRWRNNKRYIIDWYDKSQLSFW